MGAVRGSVYLRRSDQDVSSSAPGWLKRHLLSLFGFAARRVVIDLKTLMRLPRGLRWGLLCSSRAPRTRYGCAGRARAVRVANRRRVFPRGVHLAPTCTIPHRTARRDAVREPIRYHKSLHWRGSTCRSPNRCDAGSRGEEEISCPCCATIGDRQGRRLDACQGSRGTSRTMRRIDSGRAIASSIAQPVLSTLIGRGGRRSISLGGFFRVR